MNYKPLLLAAYCLLSSLVGLSQYQSPLWPAKKDIPKVPEAFRKESAVFIEDRSELDFTQKGNKDGGVVHYSVYRKVKLLDDKGLESFNKFSIQLSPVSELYRIGARTIKPDGKVIETSVRDVKKVRSEEGYDEYLLALSNVQIGDVVEMAYTEVKPLRVFGAEFLQFSLPIMQTEFLIRAPKNAVFETKVYNSNVKPTDTVIGNERLTAVRIQNVPGLQDEEYAYVRPNRIRVEFRLDYLEDNPNNKLNTWNSFAKTVYDNLAEIKSNERSAVKKFLEKGKVLSIANEEQKIIAIENLIKTEINFEEEYKHEDVGDLAKVISAKSAGESAAIRLFAAALQEAGIKHEIGLTADRFELPLDPEFENWQRPENYLIYFPNTGKYMAPFNLMRYPMVPSPFINTPIIMLKTVTLGGITKAIANFRQVPVPTIEFSESNIAATVKFNAATLEPKVDMTYSFSGYNAVGIRETFTLLPEDRQKEFMNNYTGDIVDNNEKISLREAKGKGLDKYTTNEPVQYHVIFTAPNLMDNAGDQYIFALGKLIGRQAEMYEDKDRQMDIDIAYPHSLKRELVIYIPDGYVVKNLNDIVIKQLKQKEKYGFESGYKLDGQKLTVSINEYYAKDQLPKKDIEEFRAVINAAADFNKVALVLEKAK